MLSRAEPMSHLVRMGGGLSRWRGRGSGTAGLADAFARAQLYDSAMWPRAAGASVLATLLAVEAAGAPAIDRLDRFKEVARRYVETDVSASAPAELFSLVDAEVLDSLAG